ncbi:SusC/RagA family TonB-linked outer membrane protein [Flavobacterium sp.]|uniref:SusC/RagA family TonB-linked outer membrane protein n=1 Tax=Flavobacterium sp. TaxID=239 RepID=UPI003528E6D1
MKTLQKKLLFMLFLFPLGMLAQNVLKGVVIDPSMQEPLPGVNIIVKGTSNGTATDFDGKFTLNNLKVNDVIVFSYLGFTDYTLTYTGQKEVTVNLTESSEMLQDLVIIGYGSVKKEDATGSVDLITAKEFNKGTIVSADQLLTGKAAGVRITNNGGQPDSAPNIRIRGGASLTANSSPLIVIDGIPIDNTSPAGVSNPLTLINPNDIESFTVLKDASATAIYGSRASNGVIIITTKKGTSGDPKFNYSANVSAGKVTKKIDVMNSSEFTRFIEEFHPNLVNKLGVENPSSGERVIYDTDWQDAIYRNSISTDHNFSARANLYGYLPFRASVGYTKNEGLVKTNDYERLSYSVKMTPSIFDDHLKIDMNAKGTYTYKNAIDEGSVLAGAVNMDPTKPIYDEFGTSLFGNYYQTMDDSDPNIISGQYNPVALLNQRKRPERNLRFLGNLELDYKMHFLPELRAVVNLGLDASQAKLRETFSENNLALYRYSSGNYQVFNYGKTMKNTKLQQTLTLIAI